MLCSGVKPEKGHRRMKDFSVFFVKVTEPGKRPGSERQLDLPIYRKLIFREQWLPTTVSRFALRATFVNTQYGIGIRAGLGVGEGTTLSGLAESR